jgi:hypothetical protein
MPYIIGVEKEDREFRKRVETFFHEIVTKIPPKGLKLEIGLDDDTQPLSVDNLPINIQNYVTYRHAIGHPNVAPNKDESDRNPLKKFYLEDPDQVTSSDLNLNDIEDKATACYFKYKDDEVKVDQILTMLGVNIKTMSPADKTLKLKSFTRKISEKGDLENQSDLQRFIDICEDTDLMLKYLITEMIGAQVLEKQGTTIFIKESGEAIGANAKEAVAYLKNPKNSRVYNMLRGHYESIVRKGAKMPELPEVDVRDQVDVQVDAIAKPKPKSKV